MIEHYKRLVSLVLGMHAEQATEDGTYDPQGDELEAILLAHQIRDMETRQNVLNQKESALDDGIPKMGDLSGPRYVQELQEYAKEQAQTIALLAQQLAYKKEIIRRLTT